MVKGVLDAAERHNYTTPELEELRMRFIKSAAATDFGDERTNDQCENQSDRPSHAEERA